MITHVVKRDGSIQSFDKSKLDHWAEWASEKLSIDWKAIADKAYLKCNDYCKTSDLQQAMVDACVVDNASTAHQRMAGRLYIGDVYHRLFGNEWNIPTVRQQHEKLVKLGKVKELRFSDEDWIKFDSIINHDRDLNLKYSQLVQLCKKYALNNAVTGEVYETPQFLFMRQALFYGYELMKAGKEDYVNDVKNIYEHLSKERLCAPTPDHLYVGTPRGTAPSCVVAKSGDSLGSMAALNQIVWECSANGSGIGALMQTRSTGDGIRGNTIEHNGKLEYYRTVMTLARANQQAGRSGAVTMHYTCLDPEVMEIAALRNPTTVQQRRLGEMDFSFGSNDYFAEAVRENKEWMLVSWAYAPKLHELLYNPDMALFEEEYLRVLGDESIPKNMVKARKIMLAVLTQLVETRQYEHATDELNRHTPFKDTIYSSNLCVAGDTLILTDKGEVPIKSVAGTYVNIWNGLEWASVLVALTSVSADLTRVELATDDGVFKTYLDCTEYHKWYINVEGEESELRTFDLRLGDLIYSYKLPDGREVNNLRVVALSYFGGYHETYCFNEPKRHRGIFNGILTGQCQEIALPTKEYEHVAAVCESTNLFHGGVFEKTSGEIATCNLMGINIANTYGDDKLYEEVAYYALLMIRIKILTSKYPFDPMRATSIKRMSAGVSMLSLAHLMAKNSMKYSSLWGKKFIHRVAETHSYFLHKAALRIGKEFGNAKWTNKTKYPDGWLPIDTRHKGSLVSHQPLKRDWETLRREIVENKGLAFSVLETCAPSESSSIAQDATNSIYPIREGVIDKKDGKKKLQYIAPEWDSLQDEYEIAWNVPHNDLVDCYAIVQGFTGQAISTDLYMVHKLENGKVKVSGKQLIRDWLYRKDAGLKSRYYVNHSTNGVYNQDSGGAKCSSGGCTL